MIAMKKNERSHLTRRQVLATSGAAAFLTPILGSTFAAADEMPSSSGESALPRFCLNTGTTRGYGLSLEELVEIAAEAGYDGIEPWLDEVQRVENPDRLRRRAEELGLQIESVIGFPRWAVDDPEKRAEGFRQMREAMEAVRAIGCRQIAAPPAGVNRTKAGGIKAIGARYKELLELGREMGVRPLLEIWGSAVTLGTLTDAVTVAVESGDPDASLLLDAYHLYKGGSSFDSLRLLNCSAMTLFHINDYPADPPLETISDGDRVFPGDGVAPMDKILGTMKATGFAGALSLELFNRSYREKYKPLELAQIGLKKCKASAARVWPALGE